MDVLFLVETSKCCRQSKQSTSIARSAMKTTSGIIWTINFFPLPNTVNKVCFVIDSGRVSRPDRMTQMEDMTELYRGYCIYIVNTELEYSKQSGLS